MREAQQLLDLPAWSQLRAVTDCYECLTQQQQQHNQRASLPGEGVPSLASGPRSAVCVYTADTHAVSPILC